jgi:DtxR family transcriptional regulator, Mn-dependent transcriptional regulator
MMTELSKSMQDYMKAIYLLRPDGAVSTTEIAARLEVSAASVTSMCKKLADLQLVRHEHYRGVTLTHTGRKVALEVIRHHRLIETYLAEALGYRWDEVHDEAERLEHVISEEFEDRIAAKLVDPQYDPHGDPIPSRDGRMPPMAVDRLADVNVRETVIVRRVASHDRAALRRLAALGIGIGTSLHVVARDADGAMAVRIGRAMVRIDDPLCHSIFIER